MGRTDKMNNTNNTEEDKKRSRRRKDYTILNSGSMKIKQTKNTPKRKAHRL